MGDGWYKDKALRAAAKPVMTRLESLAEKFSLRSWPTSPTRFMVTNAGIGLLGGLPHFLVINYPAQTVSDRLAHGHQSPTDLSPDSLQTVLGAALLPLFLL